MDERVDLRRRHEGSSSVITTDVVHVAPFQIGVGMGVEGPRLAVRMFVPSPEQPGSEDIPVPQFDGDGNVVGSVTYAAPIRPSAPISLVEVAPIRQ